jgi:hypothetical protein
MQQFRHQGNGAGRLGAVRAIAALAGCFALLACGAPEPVDIDHTAWSLGDASLLPGPVWTVGLTGRPGRTLLPNDTALPGENYILTLPLADLRGSAVQDVVAQAGALPSPFEFTIARDFQPLPGGALSYVARSPEPEITCVLVIGSETPGTAVLMRNCVRGDLSRALEPLATTAI